MVVNLWQHQQDAVAWARSRQAVLLHHGMGSGKTLTTLAIILEQLAAGATRIFVACPKAVIAAWVKQVGLWTPDLRIVALDRGTSKAKEKELIAALADTTPCIIVTNYESMWRIKGLEKVAWDVIVWDEVHRLKSPSGVASRWARRLTKANHKRAKRIGLSGTLIPHSILDAWAIWAAVEHPLVTWHDTYTIHKAHYAVLSNGAQKFVVGFRNLDEAHAKIAATTHHVKSSDVLDLPPIMYDDVAVELEPAEAKLYREVETEFVAVCEAGTVTPANALVQLLRIQQICGGSVRYDGEPAARRICEMPSKASALADRLLDLPTDEPTIIFCRFTSDIEAVTAAITATGRTVSELSGRVNQLAQWQAGETNVLVSQIQSGGIGVDMTRASYCWFYSLGYSLSEYEQAVARLHRPGQTKTTRIYHMTATINGRSTVDGRVYAALRDRKEVLDVIIDGYSRRNTTISAR